MVFQCSDKHGRVIEKKMLFTLKTRISWEKKNKINQSCFKNMFICWSIYFMCITVGIWVCVDEYDTICPAAVICSHRRSAFDHDVDK